ncbi:MAG: hypothetical protein AAF471_01235 [Myxococcota bacterium]
MPRGYRGFGWLVVSLQLAASVAHGSDRTLNTIERDALCSRVASLVLPGADGLTLLGENGRLILGKRLRVFDYPINPVSSACLREQRSTLLAAPSGDFLAADLTILPTDAVGLGLDDRLTQVTRVAPRRLEDDCWSWRRSEFVICGIPRWLWLY